MKSDKFHELLDAVNRRSFSLFSRNRRKIKYESHKDFLSRFIKDRLIPKGLKLELEQTIGKYDQEFIDNWFSKLKDYSFDLMKDIIKFCDKTIAETKSALQNKEANWEFLWKEKNS